ncbi:Flp pilus assembly protein CpaB [Sandarakinorhabdus sp.]|uniref:Flp pilus assembly protein CpaB n=1 Tax=Sandarakinorhabdus sp. TaxID=1916663 RepID=UPI00286E83B8|nr:Flp pilus assembly protein CpaB [Sandarakinorhabdus sp.]
MGAEQTWQDRVPQRRNPLQAQRARHDRGDSWANRSRLMLISGVVLLVVAMLVARLLPQGRSSPARPSMAMAQAVVAATAIGFGEKLAADKLKLIDVPARQLPKGHFLRIDPLILGAARIAMRPIAANEIIIETALVAGATRLSTAPLLTPGMRALAIQVNELAGLSGLVFPGDRIDVLMVRQPDEAMPYAEILAQNLRVLAVGNDMNVAREKPKLEKSITLEVSPLQAQKLTLAMANGTISLALRQFSNDARVRLHSLQVSDLNDGTTTRLVRKPGNAPALATAPAAKAPATSTPRPAQGVIVMRGGVASPADVMP